MEQMSKAGYSRDGAVAVCYCCKFASLKFQCAFDAHLMISGSKCIISKMRLMHIKPNHIKVWFDV